MDAPYCGWSKLRTTPLLAQHFTARLKRPHLLLLNVCFDHPEQLVDATRHLREEVGGVCVFQVGRLIDCRSRVLPEHRQRRSHAFDVSSPLSGTHSVLGQLRSTSDRLYRALRDAAQRHAALGDEIDVFDARVESYPNRELRLGSLAISRALPVKQRSLVGPWCFLDRFGPLTFSKGKPMDVAPHPHIGLQTLTWLLQNEVVHDDSLGYESILRPGGVDVMTSDVAHSEQTPWDNSGQLNGVQLWVALPDGHRHMPATFEHIAQVPAIESPAGRVQRQGGGSIDGRPYSGPRTC